ncbi:DMT family transporter [Verticiella sediminum]|uniref:DMT family transporter n=1 Tax=Verticiella sediminum TaxID=1247510 RepID=A0A556ABT2_9BURK|nr:DMT family transporter [Verticiella sediminum]TSH90349.1 DMT family transporter [Verticiella sediminum]
MRQAESPLGNPFAAIGCVLLSQWCLSTLDTSGKWVMQTGLTILVLSWVRYVVHLVLVLSLALPSRGMALLRSQNPRAQIVRGGAMLLATLMFFSSLQRLPVAVATAINFMAPLIVLAASPWLLGEPRRVSRWVAAGVAFCGVLVVVRPGSGLDPLGILFGLATAMCFAAQYIATRRVAQDDPITTLIWSGLVGTIVLTIALPFSLPSNLDVLAAFTPLQWLVLISTGVSGALGHVFQIQAFRLAPASLLSPFMYAQIISASTLGWLVWGHFPDAFTWVGIAIICASGVSIALLEWHTGRRGAAARR